MKYFSKEEQEYINAIKYYINNSFPTKESSLAIINFNNEFILDFVTNHNKIISKLDILNNVVNKNIINCINNELETLYTDFNKRRYYHIFSYFVRKKLNFEIDNYIKQGLFINILRYKINTINLLDGEFFLREFITLLDEPIFNTDVNNINKIINQYNLINNNYQFIDNLFSTERKGEIYLFERRDDIYIDNLICDLLSKDNISNAKESRETLKTEFSEEELIRIFNELVDIHFISDDLELFLACFGFGEDNEENITWKSSQVEFEIFVGEIVQEEENLKNNIMGLPRTKINSWFVDKKNKPIKPTPKSKIRCGIESYKTYKIIHS